MSEPTDAPLPAPEPATLIAPAVTPGNGQVPEDAAEPQHRILRQRHPVPWGRVALVLAVLMIAVLVAALAVNAPGRYLISTVLAYVADAISVVALVLGIVGIAANRGRGAGIAAVVIAVLGNPLVLLYGLGVLT